jgi:predicted transcriptional regulator of viral defense system
MKRDKNAKGTSPAERAEGLFREHGGVLSTSAATRLGIHPRTLYSMRDAGVLERLARGLYRLADLPPLGDPDLTAVSLKVPQGVICLISALSFHRMTTQVPHEVYVALERGAETPRLDHPPLRVFRYSKRSFGYGVQRHALDQVKVRVYAPAKTVADCFKFRSAVGLDTAVEALKAYLSHRRRGLDELMEAARVCRVQRVMKPYVEALL